MSRRRATLLATVCAVFACRPGGPAFEPSEPSELAGFEAPARAQWVETRDRAEATGDLGPLCRWYHAYRELQLARACYHALDPRSAGSESQYLLAHVERELGLQDDALAGLQALFDEPRVGPTSRLWAARLLEDRGELERAFGVLVELVRARPLDLRANADLVRLDTSLGRPEAALARLDQVEQWAMPHPELRRLRQAAERALGRPVLSAERGEGRIPIDDPVLAAIDELRVGAKPWSERGLELMRAGKVDEALELFRRALEVAPDWVFLRLRTGEALQRLGRYDAARAQFEVAVELEPENPAPLAKLARLALVQRRFDEAAQWSRRVIELDPGDVNSLGMLGGILLTRRPQEALEVLDRALARRPDRRDLRRLRAAASVLEGRDVAEDLEALPGDPELQRLAGIRALEAGRLEEAAGFAEGALQECPMSVDLLVAAWVRRFGRASAAERLRAVSGPRGRHLAAAAARLESDAALPVPKVLPQCPWRSGDQELE